MAKRKNTVNSEQVNVNQVQLILPYEQVVYFVNAAKELDQLRDEVKRLREQLASLRFQQVEIMERMEELI